MKVEAEADPDPDHDPDPDPDPPSDWSFRTSTCPEDPERRHPFRSTSNHGNSDTESRLLNHLQHKNTSCYQTADIIMTRGYSGSLRRQSANSRGRYHRHRKRIARLCRSHIADGDHLIPDEVAVWTTAERADQHLWRPI